MTSIRFYLDENVDHAVARGLRTRAIDVLTTPEADNMGLSDQEHLSFALEEKRVIVTSDEDFLVLSSQGIEHAGIVYFNSRAAQSNRCCAVCSSFTMNSRKTI